MRLLLLPGVPVLLTFGQPGCGITGQRIPQGRQGLFQRRPVLLLLLLLAGSPAAAAGLTILSPASSSPGASQVAAQFTAKTGVPVTVGGGGREKGVETAVQFLSV